MAVTSPLVLDHRSFRYRSHAELALEDISPTVPAGELRLLVCSPEPCREQGFGYGAVGPVSTTTSSHLTKAAGVAVPPSASRLAPSTT